MSQDTPEKSSASEERNHLPQKYNEEAGWSVLDGIIEGLVGMVPGIGPLLQSAVFQMPQRLAAIRLQAYVDELGVRLKLLEEQYGLVFPGPVDDSIRDLLVGVAKCPYDENRPLFIEMFFKLASQREDSAGLKRNYSEIIAALTPTQVKFLKSYLSGTYWVERKHGEGDEKAEIKKLDFSDETRIRAAYNVTSNALKASLDDLIAKGLVIDDGPGRWSTGPTREFIKLTSLAISFLEYVISDEELETMRHHANSGSAKDSEDNHQNDSSD